MPSLPLTFVLAVILVFIALGLLAIGWILTGSSHIKPGACGRAPTKKQGDDSCGKVADCQLCHDKDSESKDGSHHHSDRS